MAECFLIEYNDHTGILMTFYLSIILDLQNFFHWYILQSWKLKRPPIQLRPHHFWTYTSNLTTVVNSVLKFMISGTTSILILENNSLQHSSNLGHFKMKCISSSGSILQRGHILFSTGSLMYLPLSIFRLLLLILILTNIDKANLSTSECKNFSYNLICQICIRSS
jgi:hypothetical protein